MAPKTLLITGASGKQGGAVIDALLEAPESKDFTILAVTRNPGSPASVKLNSRADNVRTVQGDLHDIPGIFKAAQAAHPEPIWGVFSVQVPMGKNASPEIEETQGKGLVDEAIKQGVKQFVYTSVERGGEKSYENPTDVPHFISKHNIEHHLVDKTKDEKMGWTIIRPVAFMENFAEGFMGKMFGASWYSGLPNDKKLQLISVKDIGWYAAQSFINPEKYNKREINLAGDDISFNDADKVFRKKTGQPIPCTFGVLGSAVLWGVKEMGVMFKWFDAHGYGADVQMLKKEHPKLMSLGDWIDTQSWLPKK